ncbi:hypothetical protein JST56_03185 [Candidatus Dependentiae bacterium]|nr:hypothetical protein [Candidatus Dependentiae bacterium]
MKNLKITKALLLTALLSASQLAAMDNPEEDFLDSSFCMDIDLELDSFDFYFHQKKESNLSEYSHNKNPNIIIQDDTENKLPTSGPEEELIAHMIRKLAYSADIKQPINQILKNFNTPKILLNRDIGVAKPLLIESYFEKISALSQYFSECMYHSHQVKNSIFYLPPFRKFIQLRDGSLAFSSLFSDIEENGTIQIRQVDTQSEAPELVHLLSDSRQYGEECAYMVQLDDNRLASYSADEMIRIWDIIAGKCLKKFHAHHIGNVTGLINLPDGNLATCSKDRTIRTWDVKTGTCLDIKIHTDEITSALQLHDGRIVYSTTTGCIRILDLQTGKNLDLINNTHEIICMKQLYDGRLAFGSANGSIKILNMDTKQSIKLNEHTDQVTSIIQLKDGQLISASHDSTIKIWNINTGKCHSTLKNQWVNSCITQLNDGNILLYPIDYGIPKIVTMHPQNLSLTQIALIVQLQQHRNTHEKIELHSDWHEVFKTIPEEFKEPFLNRINQ